MYQIYSDNLKVTAICGTKVTQGFEDKSQTGHTEFISIPLTTVHPAREVQSIKILHSVMSKLLLIKNRSAEFMQSNFVQRNTDK